MKRKTLTTAIVAGLTGVAGMVSVANAVNINPDGLGQVLIYPYYTTRGGNDTLISVVNTSSQAKAAKVRFLEGLNSREVLDFNLYLSAFDVWTAAITESPEGDGARMLTNDSSCTVPYFFAAGGEQAFLDFEFTGENEDGGTTALERVRSGYVEILDMGTVIGERPEFATNKDTGESVFLGYSDTDAPASAIIPLASNPRVDPEIDLINVPSRPIVSIFGSEAALTHEDVETEDGELLSLPANCQQLVNAWSFGTVSPFVTYWSSFGGSQDVVDPEGVGTLFGSASIINVNEGTLLSYNAEPIDNWRDASAHSSPGAVTPNILSTDQQTSAVFQSGSQSVSQVNWGANAPQNVINAILMHDTILNEYVVNPGIGAQTEWVFTFPTKRFHVDRDILGFIPETNGSGFVVDSSGTPLSVTSECAAVSGFAEGQGLTPGDLADPVFDAESALAEPACLAVVADASFIQTPVAPFGTTFAGTACEPFTTEQYNREEVTPAGGGFFLPPIVSPPPPSQETEESFPSLCYEANVVSFSTSEDVGTESEIFGEPRFTTFPLGPRFGAGWVEFDFSQGSVPRLGGDNPLGFPADARTIIGTDTATGLPVQYEGLPVVGFGATTFSNSTLSVDGQTVLSNYGGTFKHRATRSISTVED
ncbi:hypothetical protein [Marinobacter sp.]|uniref:hypothetical protein n=1 Tax=Marinobacter sp. TaxID=50741 RepID=UPI002B4A41A9|nr:hypothetical protein [Marinobacter sp.]HKK57573.1 hypothetical protein [Marinobacter sp.]